MQNIGKQAPARPNQLELSCQAVALIGLSRGEFVRPPAVRVMKPTPSLNYRPMQGEFETRRNCVFDRLRGKERHVSSPQGRRRPGEQFLSSPLPPSVQGMIVARAQRPPDLELNCSASKQVTKHPHRLAAEVLDTLQFSNQMTLERAAWSTSAPTNCSRSPPSRSGLRKLAMKKPAKR